MEYLYFSKIFLEYYPIIWFLILPFIFIFLFIKKWNIYFYWLFWKWKTRDLNDCCFKNMKKTEEWKKPYFIDTRTCSICSKKYYSWPYD